MARQVWGWLASPCGGCLGDSGTSLHSQGPLGHPEYWGAPQQPMLVCPGITVWRRQLCRCRQERAAAAPRGQVLLLPGDPQCISGGQELPGAASLLSTGQNNQCGAAGEPVCV